MIQKTAQAFGVFDQVEGDDQDRYDPQQAGGYVKDDADRLGGKGLEQILKCSSHVADQILQAKGKA